MKIKKFLLLLPLIALVGCSPKSNTGGGVEEFQHEEGEKILAYFEETYGKQHSYQWTVTKIDNFSDSIYNLEKVQLNFSRKILRDGGDSGNIDGYEYDISLSHFDVDYQAHYYFANEKTIENHPVTYARNKWAGGGTSYTASQYVKIKDVSFAEKKVSSITFEDGISETQAVVAEDFLKYIIDSFSFYCTQANLDLTIFA